MIPLKPDKIIKLASSKNKALSIAALIALRNIKDERIHEIATNLIKQQDIEDYVIPLFINNYIKGDYLLLESILFRKHNKHSFHNINGLIMNVFENNIDIDATNMLIEIYKSGSYSCCRKRCITIMMQFETIPRWILNEIQYDSNLEIRQLVKWYGMHGS